MRRLKRPELVIRVDRRAAIVIAAALAIGTLALKLSSESLTVTASYPSPVGIYNQIVTTGNSGAAPTDTTFNRNAGNTILVPPTNASGNVGVGTTSPTSKLTVAGSIAGSSTIQVGTLAADPPGADGMLYYNSTTKKVRVYQGGAWADLGGGSATAGQYYTNTCVASDGNGCSATIGTKGLLTNSKTSTWSDSNACWSAPSCFRDPCNVPGNSTPSAPETITCTANNTPAP